MNIRYRVTLTPEERQQLEALVRGGKDLRNRPPLAAVVRVPAVVYVAARAARGAVACAPDKVGRLLSEARSFHRSKPRPRRHDRPGRVARMSPYLRLADWKHGRFVTDQGNVEVPASVAAEWQRVLSENALPRDASVPAIPLCIGAVRADTA
jgi:hypothetical protein